jgi:hypothetical protein
VSSGTGEVPAVKDPPKRLPSWLPIAAGALAVLALALYFLFGR